MSLDKSWLDKISNYTQLGGIETSILDNGLGKGSRIAWINTGGGLRFKVVIDRAMDISDAFYNQYSLAWHSNIGVTSPQPFSDKNTDWLRTFGGGLLVTCGITHTGGPENDIHGVRGLHDQISNVPAQVESIMQPDPVLGKFDMSITGIMRVGHPLGPNLELKRTISATLGEPMIKIHDKVTNRGNTPTPHMLLYHFNFGWPLVDEGCKIVWRGKWQSRESGKDNQIFKEGNDFRTCPAPLESHLGGGEEAVFIDIETDDDRRCACGLYNENLGIAMILEFEKDQLPWLTNWQHWGKGEFVTGLEPGTNPPIGQRKAREDGQLTFINPGETKEYDLSIKILNKDADINDFLYKNVSS